MVLAFALVDVVEIIMIAEHKPSWQHCLCFAGLASGIALGHGRVIVVPEGINLIFLIELHDDSSG